MLCTDAGHGGSDTGAFWDDVREKDLNLVYTLALNEELKRRGHTIYTTRKSDINVPPLRTRCLLINEHHRRNSPAFDAIISIHCNVAVRKDNQTGEYSALPSHKGFIAIYSQESNQSTLLSKSIAEQYRLDDIVLKHSGMLSTIELGRTLAWIHRTIPPATLLELGFMTNPDELVLLQEEMYRAKIIQTIANGIENFIENN